MKMDLMEPDKHQKSSDSSSEIDEDKIDYVNSKLLSPKQKCLSDEKRRIEMLGSVIATSCPGLRASARVIQKMKLDSVRPTTPPPINDKKDVVKDEKNLPKTPSQGRQGKMTWSNTEKNLFFDALNEFGRDFESITNFINSKLKRKTTSDQGFKTKDQVRTIFLQTFHKIAKYLKFSDDVKKPAQELYALINYGEMRRKVTFVSEKHLMKIKDLVYKGYVTLRSKGKTIKIKTPSCKALRKLNQLEDGLEDIKLPTRVEISLRPATMEAWGKVQSLAQNPVIRTVVPLQKKLSNIIKTFQQKWKGQDLRMNEELLKLIGTNSPNDPIKSEKSMTNENETNYDELKEPLLCFMPHQDTTIHRPLVSVTEYLSSFNICLNSYEKRIGVKVRGEDLCHDKITHKRQRSDSGCEKKSPEHKKFRNDSEMSGKNNELDVSFERDEKDIESSNDITDSILTFTEELNELLNEEKILKFDKNESNNDDSIIENNAKCDSVHNNQPDEINMDNLNGNKSISLTTSNDGTTIMNEEKDSKQQLSKFSTSNVDTKSKKKDLRFNKKNLKDKDINKKESASCRPLLSEDVMRQIRKGWTVFNSGDITIGDLYVAFGHDSKLMIEYNWIVNKNKENDSEKQNVTSAESNQASTAVTGQTTTGATGISTITLMMNAEDNINDISLKRIQQSCLSNKLKHLLLIANLNENTKRKPCFCGHTCGKGYRSRGNDMDFSARSFISNKSYASSHSDANLFRQPALPYRRNMPSADVFRRYSNDSRNRHAGLLKSGSLGSKQIVVKRLMNTHSGSMAQIEVKTLQNHFVKKQFPSNMHEENESSTESEDEEENDADADEEDADNSDDNREKKIQKEGRFASLNSKKNEEISNMNRSNCNHNKEMNGNSSNHIEDGNFKGIANDVANSSPFINNTSENANMMNANISENSISLSHINNTITDLNNDKEKHISTSQSLLGDDVPDLSSLMELSLPSPLPINPLDDSTNDTFSNLTPISPMQIIKETPTDPKWLEENLNDFSLTSFLGHLEEITRQQEPTENMDNTNASVISETTVDYMTKFAEIAASIQNEEKDL